MGYTHYWYVKKQGIPAPIWGCIVEDTRKLLAQLPKHSTNAGGYYTDQPLQIAFEADEPGTPPFIGKDLIRFNGSSPDGSDLGHETFHLERVPIPNAWRANEPDVFDFCKTARKPYDLAVCAVLIVAYHHARQFLRVSSDGDAADWKPALAFTRSVLGDGYDLPPEISKQEDE